MKQRTITSLFLIFLILPIIYKGGLLFHLFVYALSIFALKEIITIKETKKAIPDLIKFISYIVMSLFVLYHSSQMKQFVLDYKIIAATFLLFLLSVMFYHDEEKYSVNGWFSLRRGNKLVRKDKRREGTEWERGCGGEFKALN